GNRPAVTVTAAAGERHEHERDSVFHGLATAIKSSCSAPPFVIIARTWPTPGQKYLFSSTSGSSFVKSRVCTQPVNDPYGTVTDASRLSTSTSSSASPSRYSWR